MPIFIPEFCVLLLIGLSNEEMSILSQRYFGVSPITPPTKQDHLKTLYKAVQDQLQHRVLTIINASYLDKTARQKIRHLAQEYHCKTIVIIANESIQEPSPHLRSALKQIKHEKYHQVIKLKSDIGKANIKKIPLSNNQRALTGPFDIIGDVHGCYDELLALLNKLDYEVDEALIKQNTSAISHPQNRKIIFLGDLVDRGPHSKKVVELVMNMVTFNTALCIKGNHENKFIRYLLGKNVKLTHGLEITATEYPPHINHQEKTKTLKFLCQLKDHFVLDHGKLVVAHAGLKESLQGRDSGKVTAFALFGDVTGKTDEAGLPIRNDWAKDYAGDALVVYGHTPTKTPQWVNNTICIDTGCVFGGSLTALRYPERELISTPSQAKYADYPGWK